MPVSTISPWTDTSFPAMGSTARVLVFGGPPALDELARHEIERLEAHWSRFRAASELSRLNAAEGRSVAVSADTFEVITRACDAWRETAGLFDPTVLDAVVAAGYDRDFEQLEMAPPRAIAPTATPGCGDVELDPLVRAVRLPPGVHLDLGGIGKGFAADLVATMLLAEGAEGVCVNLGGDLRVAGVGPEAGIWCVDVDDPLATGALGSLRLASGGVATSTRLRRAWQRPDGGAHHLIDPRTGDSARTGLASVTVLAAETWWAEVLAKSAFVAGPLDGAALLAECGVTGMLVHDDGRVEDLPGLDAFRA